MNESYLGLISPRGLESLWREHEHTARFLERRLQRKPYRSCCGFWAVIDEAGIETIAVLLRAGRTRDAWLALERLSRHLGCIIPETEDLDATEHGQ